MTQKQMKQAGFLKLQHALSAKCLQAPRFNRAAESYREQLSRHETVTPTLVQLIVGNVIENA